MNNTCGIIEPSFCSDIVSKSDISGIGVRVAIYVQTLLSMASGSLTLAISRESVSRYITKFIRSIDEFDDCLSNRVENAWVEFLTTIMTAFVTVNSAYIRTLGLSVNISSFLFTTFWVYWGLQVWNDPRTFGIPEGEQNCTASIDTVFVVFGHNVKVTNSGLRGFAMFIFAIGSISALSAFWQCITWSLRYAVGSAKTAKENAAAYYVKQLRSRRTHSAGNGQHMTRYGGMVGMIYMIITTEQIVARNPDVPNQVNTWTYSQTIALIMLGQQLMDCFTYFKEEIAYRRQEKAALNGDTA